jgi:hypothetical protein
MSVVTEAGPDFKRKTDTVMAFSTRFILCLWEHLPASACADFVKKTRMDVNV